MTLLIVGANGATGILLVQQLLEKGHSVRAVVRSCGSLPRSLSDHPHLEVIEASLLDLSEIELTSLLQGCDAIASCLGHRLSFSGIFGHPRMLVADAIARLCNAYLSKPFKTPIRFVLMNTAGNSNRDLDEPISLAQRFIIAALRIAIPPHRDNEAAADFLRVKIGQDHPGVEWVVVRPDTLINDESASDYDLFASPSRSAIFDPGKTSRINVASFMNALITDDSLWEKWKGRMPVIYNAGK